MDTSRQIAMRWWNNLSSLQKTQLCGTHTEFVGSPRRWETLTGREIEILYAELNSHEDVDVPNKNQGTQRSPFGIGS